MSKAKIDIYGRKYTVTSEYDEQYIDHLTGYINGKIKDLVMKNPRLDYADACALCLLNVADDYVSEQKSKINLNEELSQIQTSYKELHDRLKKAEANVSSLSQSKNQLEREIRIKDNEIVKLKLSLEKSYGKDKKEGN